jgi:hypothetical protein
MTPTKTAGSATATYAGVAATAVRPPEAGDSFADVPGVEVTRVPTDEEIRRQMQKVISVVSMSPPNSTTTATPGMFPVGAGICRHTRRELEADRAARVAAGGGDESFEASPRHLVHFASKWICTDCGHPIIHHFDCARTMEELDVDRVRRIGLCAPSFNQWPRLPDGDDVADVDSVTSDAPVEVRRKPDPPTPHAASSPPAGPVVPLVPGQASRPAVHAPAPALSGPHPPPLATWPSASPPLSPGQSALSTPRGWGSAAALRAPCVRLGGSVSTSGSAPLFPKDPRYLVHVEAGQWVCSAANCGQPIEAHHSNPDKTKRTLFHPPPDSHLTVLARYVGRVATVSPRQSSRLSNVGPNGEKVSYATTNAAHLARTKLGEYAEQCCVCGYPDKRPFQGYPLFKLNKQTNVVQQPTVTMAHILAPDALEQVCYEDDETNYLPLCGTLGWEGTCHDAFDKNLLLFAYEGRRHNDGRFMVWASEPLYRHLSGRHLVLVNKPHRSALHARARHALTSAQVVETPQMVSEAIVKMWNTEPPEAGEEAPGAPLHDTVQEGQHHL